MYTNKRRHTRQSAKQNDGLLQQYRRVKGEGEEREKGGRRGEEESEEKKKAQAGSINPFVAHEIRQNMKDTKTTVWEKVKSGEAR